MRKIIEVLRLKFEARLSHESIAAATRLSVRDDTEVLGQELQESGVEALKRALERHAVNTPAVTPALTQSGPQIRALTEYQAFFETHSHSQEDTDGNVYH